MRYLWHTIFGCDWLSKKVKQGEHIRDGKYLWRCPCSRTVVD